MIIRYFKKIQNYDDLRFIIEITALAFLSRFFIALPIEIILEILGVKLGNPNIYNYNFAKDIWNIILYICVIAPFIETILFQLLPIKILEFIKTPKTLILIITTAVFSYAHYHEGLINAIGMIPMGFLFAWAYLVRQKKSWWKALLIVTLIHGLSNFIATILYLIS